MSILIKSRAPLAKLVRLLGIALCVLANVSEADDRLRVGVAEADITPPEGFPIAGYYHERLAEGTIDPLKAKAIVFEQGDQRAAVVVCDLTAVSRDLCEIVRKRASQETGIAPHSIAISGTHSHTAPDYSKHLYQHLSTLPSKDQTGKSGQANSEGGGEIYAEKLIGGIVQAIVDAHKDRQPGHIWSGSAQQETPVAFNRRFVMKDGTVQTWKKLNDPNVVKAAGPIDAQVAAVTLRSDSGEVRAVFSNFALHLDTVGGLRWSADYPFFIEKNLRMRHGPNMVSIFGTGCCGDINHANPSSTETNKTEFIGNEIAATVADAIDNSSQPASDKLSVRSSVVNLPLQDVSPGNLQRSQAVLKVVQDGGKVEFLEQVAAYKTIMLAQFRGVTDIDNVDKSISWGLSHTWAGIGDSLPVDVQTICIGDDIAMVFLPGEVFVDLGLAIKQASPYRTTLVVELSNGVETAYIPTRAAYAGGSYEVTNSTLKPGAGEMLVEAALRLLRESAGSQ